MAAFINQLCMGSGKSCCMSGILYVCEACTSNGAARAHCGHCKSSKTTSATGEPLGGRSTSGTVCATAEKQTQIINVNRSEIFIVFSLDAGSGENIHYGSETGVIMHLTACRYC